MENTEASPFIAHRSDKKENFHFQQKAEPRSFTEAIYEKKVKT